jgi:acylphosphatase
MSLAPVSYEAVRHVLVRGRVQGVGFRAWTEYTALDHGLEGWVRNRRDGSVEAVFAGSAAAITKMLEACRRGPRGARVEAVDQREGGPDDVALRRPGELFSMLPTA